VNVRLYQPPSDNDLNHIANWRVDPRIAGGGYFVDLGSHMIDLLQHILGPIKSVAGFSSNQAHLYGAEDTVSATFTFECGIHGVGLWNFAAGENLELTEIIGSLGKVTYSNFKELPVVVELDGHIEEFVIPHPEHVQQPLIQSVVDELLGLGMSSSSGRSGAKTSWVIDKILGRL
jgi:1,5-anhydro-D-fructose reductase (1,5-anhydro-D-mannitol-forming)